MTVTRRSHFTFVEPHDNPSRKAFCHKCLEQGRENRLVPRWVDGMRDDKFRECSYCGGIFPIYDVMITTEYEPKATTVENPFESGTKVTTPMHNRQVKKQQSRVKGFDNDIEIPKFAGKPDSQLIEALNDGAIILSISDSGDEDEEND